MEKDLPLAFWLLFLAAGAASLSTLCALFSLHIDGHPLLRYEPRRSVPWGAVAPLVVIAMPLLSAFLGSEVSEPNLDHVDLLPKVLTLAGSAAVAPVSTAGAATIAVESAYDAAVYELRTANYVQLVWAGVASNLGLAVLFHLGLAVFSGARWTDLGWPSSVAQLAKDVRIGSVACAAALLPVYAIQFLLVYILEPERSHPLIESYMRSPSAALAVAAGVSAVVAAPLFEETVFRLMFQGWLEKCEDALQSAQMPCEVDAAGTFSAEEAPERRSGLEEDGYGRSDAVEEELANRPVNPWQAALASAMNSPAEPPTRHGWTPIVVSGLLFGLAHLGHGVSPVSLIILGLVLGYVYQRTHRIVPCIVCHMLFNAFSLAILWLQVHAAA